MNNLFCDMKTDEEKANFFLSGRAYETGIIALAIQNDVAMAYHRCAELASDLATAEQDSRQKQARIERLEAAVKDLRVVIAEVHAWAVCAAIAGPEDMYENFPRIVEIGERVLKNTEDV